MQDQSSPYDILLEDIKLPMRVPMLSSVNDSLAFFVYLFLSKYLQFRLKNLCRYT